MPATSVTRTPTSSETTIVRPLTTVPASGIESPNAPKSAESPFARPTPSARPAIEAARPITSASRATERMTWRREAPSVRSVANSRVRCATVMLSVLKITKAPTNSAIAPKASRNQRMKSTASETSFPSLSARASPLWTCAAAGRSGRTCAISASVETPGRAAIEIASNPVFPSTRRAVGTSKTAIVAPPSESTSPNLASPTTR
jgi:hypothetical protein